MHVAEEYLEDYARRDCTSGIDFAGVQEHVGRCETCRDRLVEIFEYMAFLKDHPRETEGNLLYRHDTQSGTVFLAVTGSDATIWQAHALGAGVYITREFFRGSRARVFLEEWFATAYTGHRCTRDCSSDWK